jgi:transposase InsO family protein
MGGRAFTPERIIDELRQAEVLLESWRNEFNQIRPHSSTGYRPPAPVAIQPADAGAGLTSQVVQ